MRPPCAPAGTGAKTMPPHTARLPRTRDRCSMRNQSSRDATGAPHGDCGHIPGRSLRGGFRPILPKPRPLQHKRLGHEKKSRIETPSGVKRPGKRRFMAFKTDQRCAHMRSKRWQMGAKDRVCRCRGQGLFGVSLQDGRIAPASELLNQWQPGTPALYVPSSRAVIMLPVGARPISLKNRPSGANVPK
jgi:hypothetical protein